MSITSASITKKKRLTTSPERKTKKSQSYDVILPASLLALRPGTNSLLVQMDPQEQKKIDLEFEGSSGAVGRFEASPNSITLDLKGHQYSGTLHPGPTAMIINLTNKGWDGNSNDKKNDAFVARIESITNEFVALQQTQDVLSKLDGIVDQGTMDESYFASESNQDTVSNAC